MSKVLFNAPFNHRNLFFTFIFLRIPLFHIYWYAETYKDICAYNRKSCSMIATCLLIVFTFFIYLFYLDYAIAETIDEIYGTKMRILCFILRLCFVGIIPLILQAKLNKTTKSPY